MSNLSPIAAALLLGVSIMSPLTQAVPAAAADTVQAQTSGDPETFVRALVTDLADLAETSASAASDRETGMQAILSGGIDVDRMRRFVLSSDNRSGASEAEIARYDELFGNYIIAVFADQIDDLVSRRIEVREVVTVKDGDFVVRSNIVSRTGADKADVDWRVLDRDGKLRLVDVMVNGSSFNVERRAQFTALIEKDGFAALLKHMEDQLV